MTEEQAPIILALTEREAATLHELMNRINGVENIRALLPIYDKLMAAGQAAREQAAKVSGAES